MNQLVELCGHPATRNPRPEQLHRTLRRVLVRNTQPRSEVLFSAPSAGSGSARTCLFIANPAARNGRTRPALERLRDSLKRAGISYRLELCDSLANAGILSREANLAGYETVVAVGGDGTINRVVNGFYNRDGTRVNNETRLGAIHIGTSPDFHRSYSIPLDLEAAVQAIHAGATRRVFVGKVRYNAVSGQHGLGPSAPCGIFVCSANIGLGASVARLANGGIRRYAGDFLGTFFSLLRALRTYLPRRVRLQIDGESRLRDSVLSIAVGKTRYIASGIQIRSRLEERGTHGAAEREFYVVCLRAFSWGQLGSVLWSLYRGRPFVTGPALSLEYGGKIAVQAVDCRPDTDLELEFDGDPAGWCPCEISTALDSLDVLVPQIT